MADAKRLTKIAGGAAAVLAIALAWGAGDAQAAKKRSKSRGVLAAQAANVVGRTSVPLNEIIEVIFSANVDPATVTPATVQIRAMNATQTGYTKQIFGSFQTVGNVVRMFPRLPGHIRDANGDFYVEGTPNDDALENSGLQPSTNYQLLLIGRPNATVIRSTTGRPLRRSAFTRFTTASASSADTLFTARTYSDSPPPQFSFSNPTDTVPSAATQYATRGGTKGVPNEISIQLYCTRVPLSPTLARVADNITLTMLERYGNPLLKRPVRGTVYVEQNFETTLLVYKPKFPLSDRGEYALRVSKNVKDLTEQYDFMPNRERERVRAIYDFLSTERANRAPGTPADQLPDPPSALIGDWPPATDTAARGVLKANVLALGDAYPEEVDPRVMLIFTSRDEPVTASELRVEFLKSENLYEAQLSTGEWDQTVPGAASAIFTASAGTGVDGDYQPSGNDTLPKAGMPGPIFNFRAVNIPQGATIRLTGNQPITIRAINFTLNGTIDLSGTDGQVGTTYSSYSGTPSAVGRGGPGGGDGGSGLARTGNINDWWFGGGGTGSAGNYGPYRSGSGNAGVDTDGNNPTLVGGQGGQGGSAATGSASGYSYSYGYGGGGGGGGAAAKGGDGKPSSWTGSPYSAWNGLGGTGGAGAAVRNLVPAFGGAGGGASGCGGLMYYPNNYPTSGGASGGGGGGALAIQTAKSLTIGTQGQIRAIGGRGGASSSVSYYGETGGGGGGSGGSILLRTTGVFNLANPSGALVVTGGAGGAGGSYAGAGGDGSLGFVRAEDPNGAAGVPLPGLSGNPVYGSLGSFDPIGGGLPSYVYSKWADLGVDDPKLLPWAKSDVATNPTTNDAVWVQAQMTRESPTAFGTPDTTKINKTTQDTQDASVSSPWVSVKIHDRTGNPLGAFGPIPGYDLGSDGTEFTGFNIDAMNGHGFRFIRFRIFFQLDNTQRYSDPLPNVDFIVTHYLFNL